MLFNVNEGNRCVIKTTSNYYDPSRMSYELVVEDKLHWTFRLYDQDGSGEIDPDEMELIFTKFCKICESTEVNRYK